VLGPFEKSFATMQGKELDSKLKKMSLYGKEGNSCPSSCVTDISSFLG